MKDADTVLSLVMSIDFPICNTSKLVHLNLCAGDQDALVGSTTEGENGLNVPPKVLDTL